MDLNLTTLIDITYLAPLAVALRKVYAPSFDTPEAIAGALARLETGRFVRAVPPRRDALR